MDELDSPEATRHINLSSPPRTNVEKLEAVVKRFASDRQIVIVLLAQTNRLADEGEEILLDRAVMRINDKVKKRAGKGRDVEI